MPNIRISALPPAVLPLDDPNTLFEVTVLEAGEEVSRKITLSEIAGATGLDASFLTLSANAQLPNERVLTEGSNITFVDTGPNGTLTINASSATSFPLLAPDGSAGIPQYSFASDPNSGMFLFGPDDLGLSAGGVLVARLIEAGGNVQFLLPQHFDAVTPTLGFGDGGDGFFSSADGLLDLSLNGIRQWQWTDGTDSYTGIVVGAAAMRNVTTSAIVPTLIPNRNNLTSGIGQNSSGQVSLIGDGVEIARAVEVVGANQFILTPGLVDNNPALPTLAFGDGDTGFFELGDDIMSLSLSAAEAWRWQSTRFGPTAFANGPSMQAENATATNPTFVPNVGDSNSGIGQNAVDQVSIIAGGVEGIRVTEAAAAITVDIFGTLNTVAFNASGVAIFTGDVQIRDGSDFEIFDATNTNRALLTTRLGPPDTFEISGAGDLEHFDVRSFNTSVRIRDGIPLEMEEFTSSPSFVAGSGFFWVRDDVPNVPIFTDDAGTDFILNAPAVSPDPLLLSSGGAGVPSYSFAADTDTGVFNPSLDVLGLTAGGVLGLSVTEVAGAITVDILDQLSVFEATLTDSIQLIPDLVSPTINFDGATNVNFTGPSAALGYLFDQGARFGNTLRINTTIPTLLFEIATVERAAMTALATSFTVDVGGQSSGNLLEINNGLVTMWSIDATNGMRVFETGAEVDFFEIRHNGSDVLLTSAGAAKVRFSGVAGTDVTNEVGNFEARSGNALIAFDASNADFIRISQNGTDTLMASTGSASVLNTGATIGYKYDNSIYITEQAAANADTAGEGQFWTRDDVPNIPMFTNDVGIDFKLGVANDAVQARRTTSYVLTTAFADVTLDTTDIETDDAIIEHSATTDQIEAQVAGTYEVTYGTDIDPGAAGNDNIQAFGRVRLNDAGVDLPGSLASQSAFEDASTIGNEVFGRLQCSFIVVLAAGDFLTLQLLKVETGGTGIFTAEEVTVTVKRLL